MKLKTVPYLDIHQGPLLLVNQNFPLRQSILQTQDQLFKVGDQVYLEAEAGFMLQQLIDKIKGESKICPVSGWRSREEQQNLYLETIQQKGWDFTKKYVAKPGCSEHETGLAIDLSLKKDSMDFIRPAFPYWGIAQEFRKNAAAYGFIMRYPKNKQQITGIAHEPWHFRYVGIPHAEIITSLNLTLEEYHELLTQFRFGVHSFHYKIMGRLVSVCSLSAECCSPELAAMLQTKKTKVSGNNVDGFIITEWGDRV